MRVKVISGDHEAVVRHVVATLKISSGELLTGAQIAELTEPALIARVETVDMFARVSPDQKTRIISALQSRGHIAGFIGDGVNDAPAIHAAEVGLSVDGATDIARSAADIILLAPDLGVLADGVEEGRRVFANIAKYLRMGTSSNFGNMLSMALASLALPFLPLLPIQILLNNLIYDFSEIGIPFDQVDREDMAAPRTWDMKSFLRFTIVMGALSSIFDMATFAVLLLVFHADAELFRTAWFVEFDGDANPGHFHHPHARPCLDQPGPSGSRRHVACSARGRARSAAVAAGRGVPLCRSPVGDAGNRRRHCRRLSGDGGICEADR